MSFLFKSCFEFGSYKGFASHSGLKLCETVKNCMALHRCRGKSVKPPEAGNRATIEAGRQGGIQGDKAEETIIKVRLWAIPTEAPGRSLITSPNASWPCNN